LIKRDLAIKTLREVLGSAMTTVEEVRDEARRNVLRKTDRDEMKKRDE
jgi:hypothetical protein